MGKHNKGTDGGAVLAHEDGEGGEDLLRRAGRHARRVERREGRAPEVLD